VSVGTRRLDNTQPRLFLVTREAAKPKLVMYIMDVELSSVATNVNQQIYGNQIAGMQKSYA